MWRKGVVGENDGACPRCFRSTIFDFCSCKRQAVSFLKVGVCKNRRYKKMHFRRFSSITFRAPANAAPFFYLERARRRLILFVTFSRHRLTVPTGRARILKILFSPK